MSQIQHRVDLRNNDHHLGHLTFKAETFIIKVVFF
jgi:hypothetical protein